MKTEITKIEWIKDSTMSFSWTINCGYGEQPGDHYLLLYRPVFDPDEINGLCPLHPDGTGVKKADLFCEATSAQKSCKKNIDVETGQIVVFSIYPYLHNQKDPCLSEGSTKCTFVGKQRTIWFCIKSSNNSCTTISINSECGFRFGEVKLRVNGEEYELPLSLASAGSGSVVFLSKLHKSDIEPCLSGETQKKCIWKWMD